MKSRIAIAGLLLVVIVLCWLWPRKVVLSKSEYDIAMALYRVCNQASKEGLANIESLIDDTTPAESDPHKSPLQPIVSQAKSGQWREATFACRRILDDQVKTVGR